MKTKSAIIFDGAIAGILGALAVAIWFLLFDYSNGHPLHTPALLGAVVLHGGTMAQYTILHFALFIVFGIAFAALVEAAQREPTLRICAILFAIGFEAFALAGFFFLGPEVEGEITWWSVAVANLLATAVMIVWFAWRHRELSRNLLGDERYVIVQGAAAGVIGAVVVALWFFIYDLMIGRPFYTPALLGSAILERAHDPNLHVTASLVVGYSVIHLAAFIIFGIIVAAMLAASEREPVLLLGMIMVFACFEVFFLGLVAALNQSLLEALGWWMVVGANLAATLAMVVFFWWEHPVLHHRLVRRWNQQAHDATAM